MEVHFHKNTQLSLTLASICHFFDNRQRHSTPLSNYEPFFHFIFNTVEKFSVTVIQSNVIILKLANLEVI